MKVSAVGIDAGSTTFKVVAVSGSAEILASILEPSEPRIEQQALRCLDALRQKTGAETHPPAGATGYGRKRICGARRTLTEISCHAKGCFQIVRSEGLLIDIGGQDTKAIRIGRDGAVADFAMNDKCAAGTGRFLEVILGRLGFSLGEVAQMSAKPGQRISISSTCTVFAETEVISMVAEGVPVEQIVLALHRSLSERISALAARMAASGRVFLSGGVARNSLLVSTLEASMQRRIEVLPEPQLVGALGAALSVMEQV